MTQKPDYETWRRQQDGDAESEEPEHFTAEEIAAYLGVSVEDFHSQAAHGDLFAVQIDEVYVYPKKAVERFLINLGVIEGEEQW